MTAAVPTPDLAARTLQLVDVRSESRSRGGDRRARTGAHAGRSRRTTTARCCSTATRPPSCSPATSTPCRRRGTSRAGSTDGAVHGLGASDMKGGVAVMIELARAGVPARYLLLHARGGPGRRRARCRRCSRAGSSTTPSSRSCSSRPTTSSTPAASATSRRASIFHGESAHSARPWTGVNAIHELVRGLRRARVARAGGRRDRRARLPRGRERRARRRRDRRKRRSGTASVELNFRYAPAAGAEERLRALVPTGELEVLSDSPSAPPALDAPRIARLRELVPVVEAEAGVDARRPVRAGGHRRGQLRPGRDRVRAPAGRAGPDREPRAVLRDPAEIPRR